MNILPLTLKGGLCMAYILQCTYYSGRYTLL